MGTCENGEPQGLRNGFEDAEATLVVSDRGEWRADRRVLGSPPSIAASRSMNGSLSKPPAPVPPLPGGKPCPERNSCLAALYMAKRSPKPGGCGVEGCEQGGEMVCVDGGPSIEESPSDSWGGVTGRGAPLFGVFTGEASRVGGRGLTGKARGMLRPGTPVSSPSVSVAEFRRTASTV